MSSTVERGSKVEGCICPGCSHVDSVVEETTVRPVEAGDVVAAAFGGGLVALAILSGRKTKRLRCLRCGCRFNPSIGFISQMFWWAVVAVLATGALGGAAMLVGPGFGPKSMPTVSNVCTELAARPLVAVGLVAGFVIAVFFAAMIAYTNAEAERQHLYKALLKRDQGIVFEEWTDEAGGG
jgi:hypothetical protein